MHQYARAAIPANSLCQTEVIYIHTIWTIRSKSKWADESSMKHRNMAPHLIIFSREHTTCRCFLQQGNQLLLLLQSSTDITTPSRGSCFCLVLLCEGRWWSHHPQYHCHWFYLLSNADHMLIEGPNMTQHTINQYRLDCCFTHTMSSTLYAHDSSWVLVKVLHQHLLV